MIPSKIFLYTFLLTTQYIHCSYNQKNSESFITLEKNIRLESLLKKSKPKNCFLDHGANTIEHGCNIIYDQKEYNLYHTITGISMIAYGLSEISIGNLEELIKKHPKKILIGCCGTAATLYYLNNYYHTQKG